MTAAPIAQTIHPGNGVPAEWRRGLIVDWLTANGISPDDVSADDPITVIALPHVPSDPDEPWLIQVIVFTQYHRNEDGAREQNLITQRPVSFQRTVPLRTPFPTEPPTDGEDQGQADRQAAQEAPEVLVRDQEQEGVPDRHEGEGGQRPQQGQAARNEGPVKGGSRRGHQAVSEPEEDQRQEEVGRP